MLGRSLAHIRHPGRPTGKSRFYAVWVGWVVGVFLFWQEARAQVDGFSRPECSAFMSLAAGEAFLLKTVPAVRKIPFLRLHSVVVYDFAMNPPFAA